MSGRRGTATISVFLFPGSTPLIILIRDTTHRGKDALKRRTRVSDEFERGCARKNRFRTEICLRNERRHRHRQTRPKPKAQIINEFTAIHNKIQSLAYQK